MVALEKYGVAILSGPDAASFSAFFAFDGIQVELLWNP